MTGGARGVLYSKGVMIGLTSPIFGLGPGGHIFNDKMFYDAHQTQLTIFLQAGLCGLIFYLLLMFKIIRAYSYSSALLACLCAISIYSFGGDILRRLPIWLILLLIYYASQKLTNNLN
jgi:ABC-type arginine transport system permease subunit